jgi:hypothetical protein
MRIPTQTSSLPFPRFIPYKATYWRVARRLLALIARHAGTLMENQIGRIDFGDYVVNL